MFASTFTDKYAQRLKIAISLEFHILFTAQRKKKFALFAVGAMNTEKFHSLPIVVLSYLTLSYVKYN